MTTPNSEGTRFLATVTLTASDGGEISWVVAFADVADVTRLPAIVRRMEANLDPEKSKPSGFSCRGYGPDPLRSNA